MKKILTGIATIALVFSVAAPASAASEYAQSVESFSQGMKKGGGSVDAGRSDSNKALYAEDGEFVSLGFGGTLDLGFSQLMGGELVLNTFEVTNGSYPVEKANVYVAENSGGPWTLVGDVDNKEDSVIELGDLCFQYVRLEDTTDGQLHSASADGFDVDAVRADYTEECDRQERIKKLKIKVHNENDATVINDVDTSSNTGGNDANGGDGDDGGNGGDIEAIWGGVSRSSTGNGGAGGDGGNGGIILTGDATAGSSVFNVVNSNVTRISRDCGCDGAHIVKIKVWNDNSASVGNEVDTDADTGNNDANGGDGDDGGNAGDIETFFGRVNRSSTGNGGAGGDGGFGGGILTGGAGSFSSVESIVNHNFTRIRF